MQFNAQLIKFEHWLDLTIKTKTLRISHFCAAKEHLCEKIKYGLVIRAQTMKNLAQGYIWPVNTTSPKFLHFGGYLTFQ